jgi:hypothetical protein
MYEISKNTYKIAKLNNLDIYPSTKKNKKIDIYRDGKYLGSIGDSRYKDFYMYLKEDKALANERRRLYHLRHTGDTFKEQAARLLLW